MAESILEDAGFKVTARNRALAGPGGTSVSLVAQAADGREWWFDVTGGFTAVRSGLARADVLWRAIGRAHVLRTATAAPLVLLTSHLPGAGTPGDAGLRAVGSAAIFDVVAMAPRADRDRLAAYAAGGHDQPLPGFWRGIWRVAPASHGWTVGGTGPSPSTRRRRAPRGGRIENRTEPTPDDIVVVDGSERSRPAPPPGRRGVGGADRSRPSDGHAAPLLLPVSGLPDRRGAGLAVGRGPGQVRRPRSRLPMGRPPRHQRPPERPGGRPATSATRSRASTPTPCGRHRPTAGSSTGPATFGFYPYDLEPWHWEYNPPWAVSGDAGE